ncbi:MAG: S-methyl-5-thioribose-1-phosphate isomerase [Acetobacter sp.]|nr:S-methyl-5-thioribose-1-phosphate isomerase [Bacteroides sp.]MCM1342161.1 S-methyl-5-thioribose-1-phosphate isomerase [Acetobacter sp.]MCM1434368.1 S-methyl-5-thioribose-1-phosphate isomerase [Clostridiales bacterium]
MENLRYNNKLEILDQTLLPNEEKWVEIKNKEQAYKAIKKLMVRGAPAIGIFAGYSMALFSEDNDIYELQKFLNSSRPTAVNLSWATARIVKAFEEGKNLIEEAKAIHLEDIEMCRKISEYGLSLLKDGDGILTHCNAGELATSKYGTGLGPLILGKEKGFNFKVFSDETRPLLQGARLTSYELEKAGIDVTLICDNMAGFVMKKGLIDAVLVGCDRVTANGDTANKIGTSSVAVLAKYYNIPFYVLGPYSTVDFNCKSGDDIVIEEREGDEIKEMYFEKPTALKETKCLNPAFDVTDNSLITAIITDKGIAYPPFDKSLKELLK